MRRCVWSVSPTSKPMSKCLPCESTRSIRRSDHPAHLGPARPRPGRGDDPPNEGIPQDRRRPK